MHKYSKRIKIQIQIFSKNFPEKEAEKNNKIFHKSLPIIVMRNN